MKKRFTVTLVGRPNVGKSSLFNALLGYRRSIVLDLAGTTRDRVGERIDWGAGKFELVDCFGVWGENDMAELTPAVESSDAILFVVDGISGQTPFDEVIAQTLTRSGKPVFLIVNKSDAKVSEDVGTFSSLGIYEGASVSAAHRRNLEPIKEWVLNQQRVFLGEVPLEEGDGAAVLTIALIGKPNSGKSTLMNRLCGEEVSKVSPVAHTTRDPVDFERQTAQGLVRFVDTAGMRRPRSQKDPVETFSVHAAKRMIRAADVALLLIASHEPISDQDIRLLNLLVDEGKPVLVLLNFWDRLNRVERQNYVKESDYVAHLKSFPVLEISGKTGSNVPKILPHAWRLKAKASKRVTTSQLNRIVERIVTSNPPPTRGTRNFNILYASQVAAEPPTFIFFMNRREALPPSYQRYLTNTLRSQLGLKGQTIRVFFRGSDKRPSSRA